jgi:hypothetical protein
MVTSAVSATLGGRARWRVRVWPQSGVSTLASFAPWVNSLIERAGRRGGAIGSQVTGKGGDSEDVPENGVGWERDDAFSEGPGNKEKVGSGQL